MNQKTFLKIFFAFTVIGAAALAPHVLAQSQTVQTINQQPETVYTYHGQIIAAPPQNELVSVSSQAALPSEMVRYPDSDIREPVAMDDNNATSTHEANLVTTQKTYDANGTLISSTQVDHAAGVQQ